MTSVVELGEVQATFRDELIKSLQSFMPPTSAEATVVNLEAVVSDAASGAASKVVRSSVIWGLVGSGVTIISVWWMTRKARSR